MSDSPSPGATGDQWDSGRIPPSARAASTGLPPEVEAELRARMAAGAAQPTAYPSVAAATSSHAKGPTLADRVKAWGPIGTFLIFLATKLKFLTFLFPILKTGGSMLVYAWVYASALGWPFAVGLVMGIFVHEMGHVIAMWRYGYKISAPLFIPGLGALIIDRNHLRSAWESAIIGMAGPVTGTMAGIGFYLAWLSTGADLWLGLAYWTFLLNLFNLAPLGMLDGGWITGAISPRIWLVGLIVMGGMVLTGFVRNPLIFLLLFLSLPKIIHGLKTGDTGVVGQEPATVKQKQILGVSYVALVGVLWWFMAHLHMPETIK